MSQFMYPLLPTIVFVLSAPADAVAPWKALPPTVAPMESKGSSQANANIVSAHNTASGDDTPVNLRYGGLANHQWGNREQTAAAASPPATSALADRWVLTAQQSEAASIDHDAHAAVTAAKDAANVQKWKTITLGTFEDTNDVRDVVAATSMHLGISAEVILSRPASR